MSTNKKVLCVIPSRIGSTRLARKPLSKIGDKTMIEWVYAAAHACPDVDKTIVATDTTEIIDIIQQAQGQAEMTDAHIATGSDRVACISARYPEYEIVINLQGDEPFMTPALLSALVHPFKDKLNTHSSPKMATLCTALDFKNTCENPNAVKVILNQQKQAIYFSRAPIPYQRKPLDGLPVYHHIGVYAYDRDFLQVYTKLAPTPLEQSEQLEQLRAIEQGYSIHVEIVSHKTMDINTAADLKAAQAKVNLEQASVL
jgi:3-deoxy-manno-octulosonate cytidylyltransferase (CMP-KDO synthetase)